ncbi:MAG: hypothetical protein II880_00715 [Schwartzia sp.]|nr:hypothetical protein [Schwartzia sp. (in: firmicutes)]
MNHKHREWLGTAFADNPARLKKLWLRKKFSHPLYYIVPGLLIGFFLLLELYSLSAAWLFNKAMEDQDLLSGTITAEHILASPFGYVYFEGLEWKDPEGKRILYIPDGEFTVDILDTLLQRFSSTSIERLELNRAKLSIRLNEDMSVDFVRSPAPRAQPEKKPKLKARDEDKTEAQILAEAEEKRQRERQQAEQEWKNFNHSGEWLDLHILLDNCMLEVFYRERHYLLEAVRLHMDLDSKDKMKLKLATGPFGGTMIGSGIFVEGIIDFKKTVPQCDLMMLIDAVDPSSLGFGMDVHDPLSMAVHFEGEVTRPVGKGTLHFDRLRIPALDFSNVDGEIDYEDAMINFTDVHADVYGGKLAAEGWYNLDTRYYYITGHGENLRAKKALPDAGLRCFVVLDISVESKGSVSRTSYGGSFVSSKGRYRWLPFKSLSGQFHNLGKKLDFYDVKIDFGGTVATTDAFTIDNGKLKLNPIRVTDKDGNPLVTYDPDTKSLIDDRRGAR